MSREELPGLYIHVPFCASKCFYCDFYSVASRAAVPEWLDAVRAEALLYRERFPAFDSLYIGGGTPTILEEHDLAGLLEFIFKHFSFSPGSEVTVEANPESLSVRKLKTLKGLGVNRLSLGVQSLDDRELEYLGRIHTAEQALHALDTVRDCGFANISVDLIYGLEIQTFRGWRKTLDRVLEFRPEHLSCYQMTFEEGTSLWKKREAGLVRSIGEKLEGAFFIWTSRYLERHGFLHYEISNFARGPEFMCRHNRKYWDRVSYLGLGPSAHSFQAGRRWWNVRSVRKYCRDLSEGKPPVAGSEVLSREQSDLETLDLGFRTMEGVAFERLGGGSRQGEVLAELLKAGLVRVKEGRVQPTRKGFLVADSLPLMLCG